MILLRLRFGIAVSLAFLSLGAFFLNESLKNSGQDVIVLVLVAPVLCAVGILLFWITISHYRHFREWERYRQQRDHAPQL